MKNNLISGIEEDAVLEVELKMPYTLTTGKAAGTFLSALDQKVKSIEAFQDRKNKQTK